MTAMKDADSRGWRQIADFRWERKISNRGRGALAGYNLEFNAYNKTARDSRPTCTASCIEGWALFGCREAIENIRLAAGLSQTIFYV
jgi:hypothetical protein